MNILEPLVPRLCLGTHCIAGSAGLLARRSLASAGELHATVEMPSRKRLQELLVRLRHPDAKRIREVMVNGRSWADFDPRQKWVRIAAPQAERYETVAQLRAAN